MAPSRVKYAISKSCVSSSASVGQASSHSPQNMHREVSYVKNVSTLRRVASSRSQPTTIKFSGHASAHKLHPIHSVSPVSGLLFSRGAPRYRSATIGRSSGYCSVTMFLGFCARKVTARPFKKSTWNNRSRSSRMRVSFFRPFPIVKQSAVLLLYRTLCLILNSFVLCLFCASAISALIPFLLFPHAILSPKMETDILFMQEALAE